MNMTKYWVSIMACRSFGYYPLGAYVEFNLSSERVNEDTVRAKLKDYFKGERESNKSTFKLGMTDVILSWSKCE